MNTNTRFRKFLLKEDDKSRRGKVKSKTVRPSIKECYDSNVCQSDFDTQTEIIHNVIEFLSTSKIDKKVQYYSFLINQITSSLNQYFEGIDYEKENDDENEIVFEKKSGK